MIYFVSLLFLVQDGTVEKNDLIEVEVPPQVSVYQ